ncbi:hypothetical protein IAQ61_003163 [Plenodomus lingam]|uniref:Uncharacterized protein n=1 Tax=Leptosphaeria maculans (strain JN3 / isolate v23.1.3 / race Av1-4-5-6-7-8) TaxID=985895 RepID=E5ADP7_LEPMJ|nr:hypothetical protein LEMA_P001230.1 [Plenodomus lingam JN3]KAH9875699.1 hypothetical protein IAQ61_003163 [Plenodomus lingam]CBY01336.1 hypothetical protein LEMA_P001230.1 [Plenodomus lingam JN3]
MIFGGLELVAGGYLIHRHYKRKNEKEKLEQDVQQWRNNTFPGANNAKRDERHSHPHPQRQQQSLVPQQTSTRQGLTTQPQQKPQWQCQQPAPTRHQHEPRPQSSPQTQSFRIPRRPVPERKPQIIIQPCLQRTDSFATISRMPIANGSRPRDLPEEHPPPFPPRRTVSGLQLAPQHSLYGNPSFSMSSPAFGATPTSPPLTYELATSPVDGYTNGDRWEASGDDSRTSDYAPTVSTQLGEQDPPPPYAP